MWNGRVTLTVLASLVALGILCSLLGAAYQPYYSQRRAARLTANEVARLAETATATAAVEATRVAHLPTETARAGATQTEAARPTATATVTRTPTMTPTPTATAPAAVVGCAAAAVGDDRRVYPVPGGGQLRDSEELPRGGLVTIVGRLEDRGWVSVQTPGGVSGWMRSDAAAPNPPNCQANIYDLSYLLGMAAGREIAADDTFISNENGWVNRSGDPVSPVLGPDGDAQLVVNTNGDDGLRPTNPRLAGVPAFELATAYTRVNFLRDSYVGVRFKASDLTYYEVRVMRNCQIGVYATGGLVFTRPVDPGENTCTDEQADWLRLAFTEDQHLTVQFNDADPFEVNLPDTSGLYTGGGIELVVSRARATFSFLVVTTPG